MNRFAFLLGVSFLSVFASISVAATIYPAQDIEVQMQYDSSTVVVFGDGQWWPKIEWTPSPPLETQMVFEFDLSSLAGQEIAYAEFHFYVESAIAIDSARTECWFFQSNGTVGIEDFEAGDALAGTWDWDNPSPGSSPATIQQHITFDVTSLVKNLKGSYAGFNVRLAGDRDDGFDGNVFNAANSSHSLSLAASENSGQGGLIRPWLKIIPMPPQDATQWQMKQKDIHNTGRAAAAVAQDRLNSTFFDTILWQKKTTGAFYGTSMIYCDGAGPDGADVVTCSNTWPNRVTGVDRHTGKLFWQDTPGGGDLIGRTTQAFSNDGTVLYAAQDGLSGGHRCIAYTTLLGPGTNGANIWGNGADTDPTHLQMMSPTVAPDGRIFQHKWNNAVFAGQDTSTVIQEVWASTVSLGCAHSDTALYDDGGNLKVIQTGRGSRVSCFDGVTGNEIWGVNTFVGTDGSATVDPENGNIYINTGLNRELYVVGLDIDGNNLWSSMKFKVHDSNNEPNQLEQARSTGCLSHDGRTYYFQSSGMYANGKLYAINTVDGSVKWTYESHSWRQFDYPNSSPIVTQNGVVIVGNNYSGQYLAILDEGSSARLLDSITMEPERNDPTKRIAVASPVLSADGKLYLPLRTLWTVSNGDGDTPNGNAEYCLTAFDLFGCDGTVQADLNGDCVVNLQDLAEFSAGWMDCTMVPPVHCWN